MNCAVLRSGINHASCGCDLIGLRRDHSFCPDQVPYRKCSLLRTCGKKVAHVEDSEIRVKQLVDDRFHVAGQTRVTRQINRKAGGEGNNESIGDPSVGGNLFLPLIT